MPERDRKAIIALGVIAAVVTTIWAGAQLAALTTSGTVFAAAPHVVLRAAILLIADPAHPKSAWPNPIAARLPSPPIYWATTAAVIGAVIVAGGALAHRRSRLWGARRSRFGVDTSARLATTTDLRPLIVRRPTAGRFILGRVGRHLVATEHRTPSRSKRNRSGDRTSVAIVGPTRCGKTAAAISGILEWSGPAILSSVKSDLMSATIAWRRTLGEVRVFDPTNSTSEATFGWSPLRGATTITGAQKASRALIDAGPRGGAENLDFFLRLAEQLLWPHLHLAAAHGRTMRDLTRWITVQESPDDPNCELAQLINAGLHDADPTRRDQTRDTRDALCGLWALDRRTRSSAYATVQTLIGPWHDPSVVANSETEDIDLDWLLAANNTLYICGPLHEQARLAPVFGGLLGDLINQAYERVGRSATQLPPTLLVLDEAANTPTSWLPQVASTCAGIGLLLITIWQAKAQLDAAYGRLADSVLTNHGTKIIFAGVSDLATLDYASRLLGDEDALRRATTTDEHDGRRTLNISTHRTPLLPSHVLRQTRPGTALLIHGTLPPAQLESRPYFRERSLRVRADTRGRVP